MLCKCYVNMSANLENSAVAIGLEKLSFHSSSKEGKTKESWNYRTISLISHACKVILKIFQARLRQYGNWEFSYVQAGFRKGRGTRDQIANICWIIEKSREFQKKHLLLLIDYSKDFDCVDHNKLWKILKQMGIPDHLTYLLGYPCSTSLLPLGFSLGPFLHNTCLHGDDHALSPEQGGMSSAS